MHVALSIYVRTTMEMMCLDVLRQRKLGTVPYGSNLKKRKKKCKHFSKSLVW